jgi:hypothetical protein
MVNTSERKSSLNDYIIFILAVQKERDRLGRQRSHNYGYRMVNIKSHLHYKGEPDEVGDDNDDLSVMALLRAEQTAQEV